MDTEHDPREMQRFQHLLQVVLRAGLYASSALIAAGLVLALATGQQHSVALRPAQLLSEGSVGERIIGAGLIVLAATPVLRVAALVAVWLRERDLKFALLAAIVLLVLLGSALSGSG